MAVKGDLPQSCITRAYAPYNSRPESAVGGTEESSRKRKMRLTLHTDYSLRVLIHAGVADGKVITINDIAKAFDISKQHLMKVVNNLSQKGYLDTVRGRGGGIRLSRPPRDINVGEVVRDTEETLAIVGCLEQRGYCPIQRVCELRGVLDEATQAFLAVLDGYTLADLIKPRRALSSLLLLDQQASRSAALSAGT